MTQQGYRQYMLYDIYLQANLYYLLAMLMQSVLTICISKIVELNYEI